MLILVYSCSFHELASKAFVGSVSLLLNLKHQRSIVLERQTWKKVRRKTSAEEQNTRVTFEMLALVLIIDKFLLGIPFETVPLNA